MSIDFITALSRLLSEPVLLKEFTADAPATAERLNIIESDRSIFLSLVPEQVSKQAKLLITKRMREVYKYMPQTFNLLGIESFNCFKNYAITHWPNTYRRHLEDAYQYCIYLKTRQLPVNQSEMNYLRFLKGRRYLGLALAMDVPVKGSYAPSIQLFYRKKGTPGQMRLYFKI